MKNTKTATLLTLLLSSCLLLAPPVQAQILETLFTTQEERAYLDLLRKDFLEKNKENDFDIDEKGPPPILFEEDDSSVPAIVEFKLGGIITQSDGSHTIWLNNSTIAERDLPDNMTLITSGGSLALQINDQGQSFILKTGQTIDISTGALHEAYQTRPTAPPSEPEPTTIPSVENTQVSITSADPEINQVPEGLKENNEFMQALQAMQEAQSE